MTPAIAVYEELKNMGDFDFVWVGAKSSQTLSNGKSAEFKYVESQGIKFHTINAGKIWRHWTIRTTLKGIISILFIPIGFVQAFFILLRERPNLIISFGGYIALPVVVCGWLLRIKSVTHEQTITSGLSNRLTARFASKVFVSWPASSKYYPKNKTLLTGNPIRRDVLSSTTHKFIFHNNLPTIYITGGNQGSNTINSRAYKFLPDLLNYCNVIHQVGNSELTHDLDYAQTLYTNLPSELQKRYIFFDNVFGREIGEIFDIATLIVSRAGANTVSEILALNKYALLIPLAKSSGNEQLLNAEYAKKLGNAQILMPYDGMPYDELYTAVRKALKHSLARETEHTNISELPNANKIIATEILTLIKD